MSQFSQPHLRSTCGAGDRQTLMLFVLMLRWPQKRAQHERSAKRRTRVSQVTKTLFKRMLTHTHWEIQIHVHALTECARPLMSTSSSTHNHTSSHTHTHTHTHAQCNKQAQRTHSQRIASFFNFERRHRALPICSKSNSYTPQDINVLA